MKKDSLDKNDISRRYFLGAAATALAGVIAAPSLSFGLPPLLKTWESRIPRSPGCR